MKLNNNDYEYIKREVGDLFVRYKIKCIPISGYELATKMGIVLIPYSSLSSKKLNAAKKLSFDGFYFEPGDGREYIYYNDKVIYERSNMTILHEIGHAVLGHTDDTDSEVAEAEASFFAKYAIAPPSLIFQMHLDSPPKIAKVFCISNEASCYVWNYYCTRLKAHQANGCFTTYEIQINMLYENSAWLLKFASIVCNRQ